MTGINIFYAIFTYDLFSCFFLFFIFSFIYIFFLTFIYFFKHSHFSLCNFADADVSFSYVMTHHYRLCRLPGLRDKIDCGTHLYFNFIIHLHFSSELFLESNDMRSFLSQKMCNVLKRMQKQFPIFFNHFV